MRIVVIAELLHCALSASAYRADGWVPAEIWYIKSEAETGIKEVPVFTYFIWFVFYVNYRHDLTSTDSAACKHACRNLP